VVGKTDSDEQIDADILQCKADILHAHDITPLHEKKPSEEHKSQKAVEETGRSTDSAQISAEKEKTQAGGETAPLSQNERNQPLKNTAPSLISSPQNVSRPVTVHKEEPAIPRFDLAEEIMAEQRKITSIRRKAPVQKIETQSQPLKSEPVESATEQPTAAQSDQEWIISEIVARDIERMCRSDSLDA